MVSRRALTVGSLCILGLAYPLQLGFVIPALPRLTRAFHSSPAWSTWILTAFLLASAISAPLGGRLGDQFGRKRMLLISAAVACLASWAPRSPGTSGR